MAQRRMRVLVVGVRRDLALDPSAAFPEHGPRQTAMRDALPGAAALVRLPRECDGAPHNYGFRAPLRWPASHPAPTVVAAGGFSGKRLSAPREHARVEMADGSLCEVTVDDAKALMGFPREFRFPESLSDAARWRMAGNAVPPPMAEAWARSLRAGLRPPLRGP